jgi:hypothetical protein
MHILSALYTAPNGGELVRREVVAGVQIDETNNIIQRFFGAPIIALRFATFVM